MYVSHRCDFYLLVLVTGRDCETGELQLMVNFVTKGDNKKLLQPLVDQITASFPQVVNTWYSILGPSPSFNKDAYFGVNRSDLCHWIRLLSFFYRDD